MSTNSLSIFLGILGMCLSHWKKDLTTNRERYINQLSNISKKNTVPYLVKKKELFWLNECGEFRNIQGI